MGKKLLVGKSTLSIDDAPIIKKPEKEIKRLGLVSKATTKMRSFRLRVETIESLHELAQRINKKTKIKISATNIIELLILDATKDPEKVISLIGE